MFYRTSRPPAPPRFRRRIAAALSLAFLTACGGGGPPILIGVTGTFGDPIGAPMLRAARLATEHINAAGGINGRPLALIEVDDQGDPDSAIAAAATLRASRAVAVVGHLWSGTTLAAGPVYGSGGDPMPMIAPSASSPEIRWLGPHAFRLCPSDDAHGTALADWAYQQWGAESAGVLYLNNDYGRGVRQAFETRFLAHGGGIIGTFPYLDPEDAELYLDRLAQVGDLDVLLVAGYREDAAAVVAAARARGIHVPILGGDGLDGIEFEGPSAEGVHRTTAWLGDGQTDAARDFLATYAAAYPEQPAPNQPAAATWDAVHLLAAVLRTAGADRARVREGLATVGRGGPAFEGVTGPIRFTDDGDLVQGRIIVLMVRDGRAVRAETP